MIIHRLLVPSAFALVAIVAPDLALAQADPMRMAYVASANQLGVMEYCHDKGWADQAAVDAQKGAAASLPPSTDQTGLSDAEATGRKGQLLNNGVTTPISAMAEQTHTTEQALCSQMGSSAKMAATQRASMPKMPTMPGGMAMPAMPPGMTMPTMPGMPGLPKTQ